MSIRERLGLKKKESKQINSHKSPHTFETVYNQYQDKRKSKAQERK